MKKSAMVLGLLMVLVSCSDNVVTQDEDTQACIQALENRLAELENRHTEDVQAIRRDMRSILQYFDLAMENAERQGSVGESLKRGWEDLKQETERLLDKLQRELEGLSKDGEQRPGQSPAL